MASIPSYGVYIEEYSLISLKENISVIFFILNKLKWLPMIGHKDEKPLNEKSVDPIDGKVDSGEIADVYSLIIFVIFQNV